MAQGDHDACGRKEAERHISTGLLAYPGGFISGKHAPRVPVQVSPEGCVLIFPKAIDVLGGQAGGDADEHVIEGEAKELRVPTATHTQRVHSEKKITLPIAFQVLTL